MSWRDIWDTPLFPQMSVDKSIDRISTTFPVQVPAIGVRVAGSKGLPQQQHTNTTTVGEAFTFEQTIHKLSGRKKTFCL